MTRVFLATLFIVFSLNGFSQTNTDTLPLNTADTGRVIRLIRAKTFRLVKVDSVNSLTQLIGNVVLVQGNTTFYCDSAVQDERLNQIEAFGNVHINDADSVHTYSQYAKYLGNTKMAYLKKKVRLTDGKGTLTTEELEYDVSSGIGIYKTPGKLVNGENVLTSKEGYYYSDTKEAYFINDVKLVSPDRTVATDTLLYDMQKDVFTIVSPTTINDGKSVIRTRAGIYDAKNGLADFSERTTILDSTQEITADRIRFDKKSGEGSAEGNVIYRDTAQGVTIVAGTTAFNNKTSKVLATRKPVMIIKQENDSIYIAADTLLSSKRINNQKTLVDSAAVKIKDTLQTVKKMDVKEADSIRFFQAYHHVRIFSDSLQGVCDSLYYSAEDSTFRMYTDPIVWSTNNQLFGDTIYMTTRNKKPDQLYVFENGFAISRTRENFYNQIRGNRINGGFANGEIEFMRAKGNAESVYYLQDDDSAYIGMNYAKADAITMLFGKEGLKRVSWVNAVEGTNFPMNQIPEDKKQLRSFRWVDGKRPKSRLELFE
ncbi:MAG: OstA-like protein [Chitinophagaceae bacterium]